VVPIPTQFNGFTTAPYTFGRPVEPVGTSRQARTPSPIPIFPTPPVTLSPPDSPISSGSVSGSCGGKSCFNVFTGTGRGLPVQASHCYPYDMALIDELQRLMGVDVVYDKNIARLHMNRLEQKYLQDQQQFGKCITSISSLLDIEICYLHVHSTLIVENNSYSSFEQGGH
jgi:hypothetical protein